MPVTIIIPSIHLVYINRDGQINVCRAVELNEFLEEGSSAPFFQMSESIDDYYFLIGAYKGNKRVSCTFHQDEIVSDLQKTFVNKDLDGQKIDLTHFNEPNKKMKLYISDFDYYNEFTKIGQKIDAVKIEVINDKNSTASGLQSVKQSIDDLNFDFDTVVQELVNVKTSVNSVVTKVDTTNAKLDLSNERLIELKLKNEQLSATENASIVLVGEKIDAEKVALLGSLGVVDASLQALITKLYTASFRQFSPPLVKNISYINDFNPIVSSSLTPIIYLTITSDTDYSLQMALNGSNVVNENISTPVLPAVRYLFGMKFTFSTASDFIGQTFLIAPGLGFISTGNISYLSASKVNLAGIIIEYV